MSAVLEAPPILFDEAKHIYTVANIVRPSVTGILKGAGLVDDQWFTETAAWRGTVAHAVTQLEDEDDLVEESVDDGVKGYLDAYRNFKVKTKFLPQLIEARVFNSLLNYAGTLDRTGFADGCKTLVDLKTGVPTKPTALQTVGYALCLEKPFEWRRFAVQLKKDGNYKCVEYYLKDFQRDKARWVAAVTVFHTKIEWRIL